MSFSNKWPTTHISNPFAMLMPHLILARTEGEHDASIGKTPEKRLNDWLGGRFETLCKEAKALQKHAQRKRGRHNYDAMRDFNMQMTARRNSNTIGVLNETQKGVCFPYIRKKVGKTVLQILQEKHP